MMSKVEQARLQKLKEEILPRVFPGGTRIQVQGMNSKAAWASKTYCASVDTREGVVKLIVKYPPESAVLRKLIQTDGQYHNESVIYNEVLPEYARFVKEHSFLEVVPKCFFADTSVVLLEDLREKGFRQVTSTSMDLEHVLAAMTALGRYHGVGFAFGISQPAAHTRLVDLLLNMHFTEDVREENALRMQTGAQRGTARLLRDGSHVIPRGELETLHETFAHAFDVLGMLTTSGTLRVLCHGDFCGNNLLFRDSGSVCAKLIDFQTPYYASPAIDIAFFLYLNTDRAFRDQHLSSVLASYHSTLHDTLSSLLPSVPEEFSLANILKDFTRSASYAYFICSFFLPVMLSLEDEPPDLEEDLMRTRSLPEPDRVACWLARGGEMGTKAVVELLEEHYERGYLDRYLKPQTNGCNGRSHNGTSH